MKQQFRNQRFPKDKANAKAKNLFGKGLKRKSSVVSVADSEEDGPKATSAASSSQAAEPQVLVYNLPCPHTCADLIGNLYEGIAALMKPI